MLTMAAVLIAVAALGGITLATLHLRQKGLPMARFRDYTYTDKLFAKHGMKSVGYWTALDEPVKSSTFFYILEHPSREAAAANWQAFQDDLEWKTVKAKSEEHGKLVEKIDSTFLTLTDFSPLPRI
ncbi:MAG: NIPSNAP family protein [Acidobacteria bacterium]|nr:MAG: hypothetical protein AUH13_02185 [Acidobacteria bacterium 13_2_20CM_58_27]PYT85067.1 MAG: NIPSNAP family protein [Acidobacteriota bacterium]